MMENNSQDMIPEPALRRLPWYLAYVSLLHERKVEYVSSTQISRELKVDASQIAKDLSFLNIRGKTRIGYEVAGLERELQDFLGFKCAHNAVIIGVGSLGAALMQDSGLSRFGLNIVAGFDIDPDVLGVGERSIPVYHMDEFASRLPELKAEIGIVTVPADKAQHVADVAAEAGIKALWNFTPCRLRTAPGIVMQDTSIYAHLALMYNRMDQQKRSTT